MCILLYTPVRSVCVRWLSECAIYRIYPASRLARKGLLALHPYLKSLGIDLFSSCILRNPFVPDDERCPTAQDMYVWVWLRPYKSSQLVVQANWWHTTDLYIIHLPKHAMTVVEMYMCVIVLYMKSY